MTVTIAYSSIFHCLPDNSLRQTFPLTDSGRVADFVAIVVAAVVDYYDDGDGD
jgi:hypothetical protein